MAARAPRSAFSSRLVSGPSSTVASQQQEPVGVASMLLLPVQQRPANPGPSLILPQRRKAENAPIPAPAPATVIGPASNAGPSTAGPNVSRQTSKRARAKVANGTYAGQNQLLGVHQTTMVRTSGVLVNAGLDSQAASQCSEILPSPSVLATTTKRSNWGVEVNTAVAFPGNNTRETRLRRMFGPTIKVCKPGPVDWTAFFPAEDTRPAKGKKKVAVVEPRLEELAEGVMLYDPVAGIENSPPPLAPAPVAVIQGQPPMMPQGQSTERAPVAAVPQHHDFSPAPLWNVPFWWETGMSAQGLPWVAPGGEPVSPAQQATSTAAAAELEGGGVEGSQGEVDCMGFRWEDYVVDELVEEKEDGERRVVGRGLGGV
jgi:hypothetical protein